MDTCNIICVIISMLGNVRWQINGDSVEPGGNPVTIVQIPEIPAALTSLACFYNHSRA